MGAPGIIILIILGLLVGIPLAVIVVMYIVVPIFKGIGWLVGQVVRFIAGEVGDVLRIVGGLITSLLLIPRVIFHVLIGRWSASAHYGRAIQAEFSMIGSCLYRIVIGHPARLLCLTAVTEGIEKRLPEVVAAAPGSDRPSRRLGQFDGYKIVGSLPVGGSGGKLYVAEPDAVRLAGFQRGGQAEVEQVVIKAFSLQDGSSLPQIVRESRALDAAKRLGLILDHELSNDRFYYVMRYVPGEPLGLVTQRLHAASGTNGLHGANLRSALGYSADLLKTLEGYHAGGLWHKDVKPDNIIVDRRGAHLVDLGLVTPLRSAMTLTTHGTEYFRDPEMVRLALRGVKVHQVDGAKFDIYAAGAVLYSVIENSFPAHGGLSQITKRCPEAVRWIVRRAMTDYDKRYATAGEMMADLRAVIDAPDAFALKPVELPSMRGGASPMPMTPIAEQIAMGAVGIGAPEVAQVRAAATPVPPAQPSMPPPSRGSGRPKLRVTDWWTGRYAVEGAVDDAGRDSVKVIDFGGKGSGFVFHAEVGRGTPRVTPARHVAGSRGSAREQVTRARQRAAQARARARSRMSGRALKIPNANYASGMNAGAAMAVFLFLAACVAFVGGVLWMAGAFGRRGQFSHEDFAALPLREPSRVPATVDAMATAHFALDPSWSDFDAAPIEAVSYRDDRPVASPVGTLGTALVISDLQPPLADDVEFTIEGALDRLQFSGFDLAGAFTAEADSNVSADTQIELEAGARAARAQMPLESSEAATALQGWLSGQDLIDLVVWVCGSGEEGNPSPHIWVYGLPEGWPKANLPALTKAVHALQGAKD